MTGAVRPIRVAHVVVAGEIGGAEHMLRDLARSSADVDRVEHVIAVLTPIDALCRFFEDAGLAVRRGGRIREDPVSSLARAFGSRAVNWLASVLRVERATIVQLHTFGSHVLGTRAAQRAGLPVLRTEHSTRVYDDPTCWPLSRYSLLRARAVVAISAHVRDVALARAPSIADRVRVVANGVDVARFAAAGSPGDRDAFTFALVGRLEPRKGVDRALRALARTGDARLEIVGDGAERRGLESLSRELGLGARVTFHGYLDDPRPVLGRAHAALASSRKEGLGIAFLEAMAAGLPLVAVPVGGLVEIVEPGVTGLLAESDSVDALARAMIDLAADRARAARMGAAARRAVEHRYSLESMRAGYRRVYAELS
jgi:glycosyltransferase involved in cell wall biosynthesis